MTTIKTIRLNNFILNYADIKGILIGILIGGIFLYFKATIAALIVAGIAIFIYFMYNPYHSLLCAIAAIPFEMVGRLTDAKGNIPISLSKLLGIVALLSLLWNIITQKKKIKMPLSFALLSIFAVVAFINYPFVIDKEKCLIGLQRLIVTIGFYFLIIQLIDSKKRLKEGIWAVAIVLIFVSGYSLVQRFGNVYSFKQAVVEYGKFYGSVMEDLDAYSFVRTTGFYADPDIFALALLIPAGLLLWKACEKDIAWHKRLGWIALIMIVCGGLVSSYSRSGMVGFFALFVLMCIYLIKPKPVFFLYILIVSLIIITFIPSSYIDRVVSIFTVKKSYTSSARLTIYRDGFSMFLDNWFMGVGTDNFPANFERYTKSDIRPAGTMNLYLQVAAEYGIVGFILFSLLVIDIFRKIYMAKKLLYEEDKGLYHLVFTLQIIIISMFVCGMTIHFMERKEFWLLMGLSVVTQYIEANPKKNKRGDFK